MMTFTPAQLEVLIKEIDIALSNPLIVDIDVAIRDHFNKRAEEASELERAKQQGREEGVIVTHLYKLI